MDRREMAPGGETERRERGRTSTRGQDRAGSSSRSASRGRGQIRSLSRHYSLVTSKEELQSTRFQPTRTSALTEVASAGTGSTAMSTRSTTRSTAAAVGVREQLLQRWEEADKSA